MVQSNLVKRLSPPVRLGTHYCPQLAALEAAEWQVKQSFNERDRRTALLNLEGARAVFDQHLEHCEACGD